jgi:hypothetical protein
MGVAMAYAKTLWAEIRAEYESGQHASLDDAYAAFAARHKKGKKGAKIPTLRGVRNKSKKEQWDKGRHEDEIEAQKKELAIDRFARIGLTPETVAEQVKTGVMLGSPDGPVMQRIDKTLAALAETHNPELLPMLRMRVEELVADLRTALGYIDQYNKMTGGHAPRETKLSGKVGISATIEDSRTAEELNRELKETLRDLATAQKRRG